MNETDATGIETAWDKLQRDWQNDEAHRRFLALCAMHGALEQAGRRYFAVREADPARRDEARRRLDAVRALATEQLTQTRTARAPQKRRVMWLLVGVCGFVVIRAVLALLRQRSQ